MAQAAAANFEAPYKFQKDNVTVVLRHSLDHNLRHKPGNKDVADADGGYGKLARFKAVTRRRDGILEATFQNENTDDYLRIHNGKVDIGGKGGKWCWFRVHRQNVGIVKLESAEKEGEYVAVDKEGVRIGKGGPWCRFHVYREGNAEPFSKPYMFMKQNIVVVEHRDEQHIRVMNDGSVNSEGGKGELARFEATPGDNSTVKLKSVKYGKYLRIKDGKVDCDGVGGPWTVFKVHPVDSPNQVRLESHKVNGEFVQLAPGKKSLKVGDGKHKTCFFTFYRDS